MEIREDYYDEDDLSEDLEDLEFDNETLMQKKRKPNQKKKGTSKSVQCPKCDKVFSQKVSLKQHLHSVLPCNITKPPKKNIQQTYRPSQCPECMKVFTQNVNMKIHLKSIHQGIKVKCEYCSKTASNKSNLKKHIRLYCPSKPI